MNSSNIICTYSKKISVIIPTYYRPYELSELFDSILRQTITPVEIIVVDDTPNDIIKIVCEEYKSKYENINTCLKYFRNPRDRSIAIARNVGIENAIGDIILFVDSDMLLHMEFIEKILEVFRDNSNALGVQGWMYINIEDRTLKYYLTQLFCKIFSRCFHTKNSCKFYEYPVILTKIINCTWLSSSNVAYKRNVLNEFRFDENLKKYSAMEDKLLSRSIFQKYPDSLFITPYARSIHKHSETGRMENKDLNEHYDRCRKYVLMKLFGFKGLLIYKLYHLGTSIIRIGKRCLKLFMRERIFI